MVAQTIISPKYKIMNKTTLTGIISFFIIGLLLGSQLHGCRGGAGGNTIVSIKKDTVVRFIPRTDTLWHTIALSHNIPYRMWGHDTVWVQQTAQVRGRDTLWQSAYEWVSDTVAYADTICRRDEFRAVIFDTLSHNRIIGRSLRWANLSPVEVQTITNTVKKKSPLVKVYVGADAYGGRAGGKYDFDLAPAASLVFGDRYMIDLGYYIFNRQVTAGMKVKLSFKK
jgi:hypothetical protein